MRARQPPSGDTRSPTLAPHGPTAATTERVLLCFGAQIHGTRWTQLGTTEPPRAGISRGSPTRMRGRCGGPIYGIDEPTIDHVAYAPDLSSQEVIGLSRFDDDGRALSDHFGVVPGSLVRHAVARAISLASPLRPILVCGASRSARAPWPRCRAASGQICRRAQSPTCRRRRARRRG